MCRWDSSQASVTYVCQCPFALLSPVCLAKMDRQLPVFSGPLGRKNPAREGVMGNGGYLASWFGVLLAGGDLPKAYCGADVR